MHSLNVKYKCQNPLLLITFNKFDTALRVVDSIRKARVQKIYLYSDGGRNKKEHLNILNFREEILRAINWECEIKTFFNDKNMGCQLGPYQAITWFFSLEEQGIILEDDCLPTQSFYYYCDILLEKFKDNPSIFLISGMQFCQHYTKNLPQDYFFTKTAPTNGWASWDRSWKNMAIQYQDFKADFKSFERIFISQAEKKRYQKLFNIWKKNGLKTAWDYQFGFHILKHQGLCISPRINMITNIGLQHKNATHPIYDQFFVKLKANEMYFPIKHPSIISRDKQLEIEVFKFFKPKNLLIRAVNKIARKIIKKHIF